MVGVLRISRLAAQILPESHLPAGASGSQAGHDGLLLSIHDGSGHSGVAGGTLFEDGRLGVGRTHAGQVLARPDQAWRLPASVRVSDHQLAIPPPDGRETGRI